jgi:hypothetical protein
MGRTDTYGMQWTSASSRLAFGALQAGPDWVVAEMPPGYQNRVAEIERMLLELEEMGRFGRLLYETGPGLAEIGAQAFAALKFETELLAGGAGSPTIAVRLDKEHRLLVQTSAATEPIQRKGPELAQVFQLMHETAEESDRVVLLTNVDAAKRPAERGAAFAQDALAFFVRLGAVHITAPTLFALWKYGLVDPPRARAQVERMHGHAAGTFEPQAAFR